MVKRMQNKKKVSVKYLLAVSISVGLLLPFAWLKVFASTGSYGTSAESQFRNYRYQYTLNSSRLPQGQKLILKGKLTDRIRKTPIVSEKLQADIIQGQSFGGVKNIASQILTTDSGGNFNMEYVTTGTSYFRIDITPEEFVKGTGYDASDDNKLHPEHAEEDLGPTIDFEVLPAFFKYFR